MPKAFLINKKIEPITIMSRSCKNQIPFLFCGLIGQKREFVYIFCLCFCFQARSTGSPLSQFLYGPAADPLSSPPPAHMGKQFYLQDLSKDLLILCAWCFIKVLFIFQASDLLCTLCLTRNIPIPCLELINWLLGKKRIWAHFHQKFVYILSTPRISVKAYASSVSHLHLHTTIIGPPHKIT